MDQRKEHIEKLLHKYINHDCNHEELILINEFLQNPENKNMFFEILERNMNNKAFIYPVDNQSAKDQLWLKIRGQIKQQPENVNKIFVSKSSRLNVLKVAAVILLTIIGTVYFISNQELQQFPDDNLATTTEVIKEAPPGQKRRVTLSDGSRVILNSQSQLTIPFDFNQENRTVYLEGEAFFEVERNENSPFMVVCNNVNTTVLGTSFNVDAYPHKPVKVAVVSGKVMVADVSRSINLLPSEMVIYEAEDEKLIKSEFDDLEVLGWKDGILVFKNDNFYSVIKKLEMWYGVSIEVEGTIPKGLYTANHENESLENVLEGLSFSGNFDFNIEGKNVSMQFL